MVDIDPKLRQAKAAAEKKLLHQPGVTGVDIGFKEVGGNPTDTLAIRVLVEKKLTDVPSSELVPQAIKGFPTDVIERKFELHPLTLDVRELILAADNKEYPVVTGGISIGPCRPVANRVWGGTLGAVVKDNVTGKPMILSNFHVLCVDKSWSDGDPIAQPARTDGGTCPIAEVGVLKRAVLGGQVDCAAAELSSRQTDWEVVEIGKINGRNTATVGETVRKRGRTTGLTYGTVDTVDLTVSLDFGHGIGTIELTNQIGIKPDPIRSAKFGDSGDSGSVIINDANEVVGLYFAGDPTNPYGLANPIDAVLTALNVTMPTQGTMLPSTEEPNQPPPQSTEPPPAHHMEPPPPQSTEPPSTVNPNQPPIQETEPPPAQPIEPPLVQTPNQLPFPQIEPPYLIPYPLFSPPPFLSPYPPVPPLYLPLCPQALPLLRQTKM
jgi:Peptidase S7, Flavivirus NS3 serine protease